MKEGQKISKNLLILISFRIAASQLSLNRKRIIHYWFNILSSIAAQKVADYNRKILNEGIIQKWCWVLNDHGNNKLFGKSSFTLLRRIFLRNTQISDEDVHRVTKTLIKGFSTHKWTRFLWNVLEIFYIISFDYPLFLQQDDGNLYRVIVESYNQDDNEALKFLSTWILGNLITIEEVDESKLEKIDDDFMQTWRKIMESEHYILQSDICLVLHRISEKFKGKASF